MDTPTSATYLDGTKRSLPKQVLKRLHPEKSTSAQIIAFNKKQQAVLIRVVYGDTPGNVFTSGYYVVVRRGVRTLEGRLEHKRVGNIAGV